MSHHVSITLSLPPQHSPRACFISCYFKMQPLFYSLNYTKLWVMSLLTLRILSGFQSHLTLSPEGGLRSAIMCRLCLAGCRSCWQLFFHILTLSGKPRFIFMPPSNGNECWYSPLNDIKKCDLTRQGRCTKSQPRTSFDSEGYNLSLQYSCWKLHKWPGMFW